jgi:membrane associated rhomboid family serine protease
MPTAVFALLVLSGAALYFMTPDERAKLVRSAVAAVRDTFREVTHSSSSRDPFDEFLRARTGWPIVTPLLVALNLVVFTLMLAGHGALDDPQTLIEWGGNFAPRTTNGEWWRLVAAAFVHAGMLHLVATMAGLVTAGLVLERAIGRIAFATLYIAAALVAGVVSLWTTSPTTVSIGASGAVFGIYGLLLASVVCSVMSRPALPVPLIVVKRLAAGVALFFLYNLVTDYAGTASELAGLSTGFVGGLVVARGVTREKPKVRRAAMVMAATTLIAIGGAIPLHGIVDVRPEIARIAAVEERTAGAYDVAVAQFRLGRMSAAKLVEVIDRSILPELQGMYAHLAALRGVTREQMPLVVAAKEYSQLREQSWRRRAEGLRRHSMIMLREADQTERAALDAFEKIRPAT